MLLRLLDRKGNGKREAGWNKRRADIAVVDGEVSTATYRYISKAIKVMGEINSESIVFFLYC